MFPAQGFGNVGAWAADILTDHGGQVLAVSDAFGAIQNENGLDIKALRAHVAAGGLRSMYAYVRSVCAEAVFDCPVLSCCSSNALRYVLLNLSLMLRMRLKPPAFGHACMVQHPKTHVLLLLLLLQHILLTHLLVGKQLSAFGGSMPKEELLYIPCCCCFCCCKTDK
jgi:hypothetical protein